MEAAAAAERYGSVVIYLDILLLFYDCEKAEER